MSIQILMPALSPTMEEGKLTKWHVKEGDEVHSGDVLAEIETDKATMEFEAVDEGRIGKILVPEGSEGVKVNQQIAVLLGEGEDASAAAVAPAKKAAPAKQAPPPQKAPTGNGDIATAMQSIREAVVQNAPAPAAPRAPQEQRRIFATPLARRLAATAGIDLGAIRGSGPRGRIVKSDIETVQSAPGSAGVPARVAEGEKRAAGTAAVPGKPAPTAPAGLAPIPDAK